MKATGRTGRLKEDAKLCNIAHLWPAGTIADEVAELSNSGLTWLLRTQGQNLGPLAKADLRIRYPTISEHRLEIDP